MEHSARRGTFHLEMKLDFFLKKSLTGGVPGLARLGKIPHSLYKHYIKGCRVPYIKPIYYSPIS